MKGNPKLVSVNSLSPLGVQKTEFGAASQTLLTGVRLRQLHRLGLIDYFSGCWEGSLVTTIPKSCAVLFVYVLLFSFFIFLFSY